MKHLCLILLSLGFGLQLASQNSSDLEVLKFNWSKERIGWERDPFSGPIENFDEVRARTRNEKRIEDAKRGSSAEVDKIKREAKADAANIEAQHKNVPSRYVFVYKTTVKNIGNRTVKSIDWDYVFLDRSNDAELGRQQFTSEERIAPGKTKELLITITKPPTHTISVTALNKSEGDSLRGYVLIVGVEYVDGTKWSAPQPQQPTP
jgi:hypothetical protein